jgi:hypothetical protein
MSSVADLRHMALEPSPLVSAFISGRIIAPVREHPHGAFFLAGTEH